MSTTVADMVTLTGRGAWVNILNKSASADLYVLFGGTTVPTSAADNTICIPAGGSLLWPYPGSTPLVVHLVGNGNPYSVQLTP